MFIRTPPFKFVCLPRLKRKNGSKGQSKLTDEQLALLDEIIQEENLQTAREVKDKIEKEFNENTV